MLFSPNVSHGVLITQLHQNYVYEHPGSVVIDDISCAYSSISGMGTEGLHVLTTVGNQTYTCCSADHVLAIKQHRFVNDGYSNPVLPSSKACLVLRATLVDDSMCHADQKVRLHTS